jgi:mono/diheme cytochrome c family protein
VGPDLGAEGHRHSDDWHFAHFYAPAAVVRGSRMPAYRHLFNARAGRPVPTPEAIDLVAYLQALGRGRRDVWAEFRGGEPEIPAPPPAGEALMLRGRALYADRCASCHGETGDGRGEAAGLLLFPPRDLTAGRYRFKSTPGEAPPRDADLFRIITLGTGTGAAMPGFHWLPPEDRWALVLTIKEFSPGLAGRGLRAEPRAAVPAARGAEAGRAEAGRVLWGRLGCAACHAESGGGLSRQEAGAGWAGPDGAPVPRSGDLRHACALRGGGSGEAIERAVVLGIGLAMPSYGDALPGALERRALRDYIHSLDRPGAEPLPLPATSPPATRGRRSPSRSPGRSPTWSACRASRASTRGCRYRPARRRS